MLPRDTYFVLFCDVDRWQGAMDVVLQNTYAVRASRRYYTFAGPKIADWQQRVPDGYRMRAVDAELLARTLDNGDDLVEGILAEWCSLNTFFKRGFGSCFVHDG
ncbi:MAG: GNAT family N-acetyltransferase, partial [Burkholderiales bacterium]|nr:GNAT family N-acetyltransferase [Burkholderiales bacterium]